jgi:hypothetical protein
MTKDKRKPPSRIKYEQSHPVVSCRVPKVIYDRLQDVKQRDGRSFTDILKIGLRIRESKAKKEDQAYSEGYEEGYNEAKREYRVTYACSVCGKTISLNSESEKEAASQYMEEHNWGHAECHKKRQQGYL